jgi:MSHA biogenesis protein MshI
MSLITKINKLFSKKKSAQVIGISLLPSSLDFCSTPPNQQPICQKITNSDLSSAISTVSDKVDTSGSCNIVLSVDQYQIVQVDKPKVPDAEVNGALKWQVKDLVPYGSDNMVVDYFDGPQQLSGASPKINVVCADLTVLRKVVEQINDNDLDISVITTPEFAFTQLIPFSEAATLLVCQHAQEDLLILIVKQGRIYFQRRIRGLSQISLRTEEELTMGAIDTLSLEIQRSTDYFERQLKQAPIKDIEFIIPMPNEAFLVRKISENTNVPVNLLKMPDGYEAFRPFACTVGAALLNNTEATV